MTSRVCVLTIAFVATVFGTASAQAQRMEKVKIATAFLGLWDTSQPTFCQDRGEFAKAGLDVEVVSTRGGSELIQAVTAGGLDISYSVGTNAVFAAYNQGGKIRIVSAEFMGSNDTFFYVPADSPIKTIDDLKGKSVAYPRPGGSSEAILLALKAERNLDFKPVATGGMDATFTMTMTKQVGVGYSVPPSVLDAVERGQVRVVFAGDDVQSLRNLTQRVIMASTDFVKNRRPVAAKFLEVLDGCINWAYANRSESAKMYATLNKIEPRIAEKALEFYKRETLAFGPIKGMSDVMKQAVDAKFIDNPLTPQQLGELVEILYPPPK
jgi:NitT/TauT family transport system substrate-binding protein